MGTLSQDSSRAGSRWVGHGQRQGHFPNCRPCGTLRSAWWNADSPARAAEPRAEVGARRGGSEKAGRAEGLGRGLTLPERTLSHELPVPLPTRHPLQGDPVLPHRAPPPPPPPGLRGQAPCPQGSPGPHSPRRSRCSRWPRTACRRAWPGRSWPWGSRRRSGGCASGSPAGGQAVARHEEPPERGTQGAPWARPGAWLRPGCEIRAGVCVSGGQRVRSLLPDTAPYKEGLGRKT